MRLLQIPFALLTVQTGESYGNDRVHCVYEDRPAVLPPDLAAMTLRLVDERQHLLGIELRNEPSYRLADFRQTGQLDGVQPGLELRLQRTNYFDFISSNLALDMPLLDGGQSLRSRLPHEITSLQDSVLANPLSVMVLVVSRPDQAVVLPRRSLHVAFDQGVLQVSAGGAMRLAVDCDETLAPSPFVTAQRETAEELGIRLPLEAIRFLGLGVDTRTGEPELLGVAETALSVQALRRAAEDARHGNDELAHIEFVPFDPASIGRLLAEEKWCPGDWVCCWLALAEHFGLAEANRVVAWETCHGETLPPLRPVQVAPEPGAAGLYARFKTWQKGLPLPVRKAYGRVRRVWSRQPIWDDPEFKTWYAELLQSQWWTREQLDTLQATRLQALLQHAYEHVPYYRRVFDERKLTPSHIQTQADLPKLPVLTKEDVRRNLRELVARNIDPKRLYYFMTGGTTGTPLGFYHEHGITSPHEDAFMYRQWSWLGYRFGDPICYVRGYTLRHHTWDGEPAWWDYNTAENSLVLSIYDINARTLPLYIHKLREFRPRFIQGYPSALEIIARYMQTHGIADLRPSGVFTEFENLYPAQRALIEAAFQCPVIAGYGHSERAVDAVECVRQQGYHLSMEYGIVELTDDEGRLVPAGERGYVTGTGLDTHCMPFIRYQTDDVARLSEAPCACGRQMPRLIDIVGRWQHEAVVANDGSLIPITSLNVHSDAFAHVDRYQFYQEQPGALVVRIVRNPDYREADTGRIIAALQEKFRGSIEVRVVYVPEIARTRRGKFRMLEQKLNIGLHATQETPEALEAL